MKHLKDHIYESIFDIEKNTQDTTVMDKMMFEDYNSDLWKFMTPMNLSGSKMSEWDWARRPKSIDTDKKIIDCEDMIISIDGKIDNPLTNKYTLICNEFYIGGRAAAGPHPEPMSDCAGFKNIVCNGKLQIDGMAEKLGGFVFDLNKDQSPVAHIDWAGDLDYFDAEFNFKRNDGILSFGYCWDFPDLKNVKSNCKRINIYSPSLFDNDNIKRKLENLFGSGEFTATNGFMSTPRKTSLRNIVATANNIKKYGVIDPCTLLPAGKVSDLIDLRGCKDVKVINMSNNNVEIKFVKDDSNGDVSRHARYLRINTGNRNPLQYYIDGLEESKTKDGWYVLIEKKYF